MRQDAEGYFYFVDRIGDTFRWKGENVSTGEVGAALSAAEGVVEANVYGVEVPGQDGRAGMAALVVDKGFDVAALQALIDLHLPSYARPVFLRLQSHFEITGTFKYRKVDLVADGFDPGKINEPLYFRPAGEGYRPLGAAEFAAIGRGEIRI
jgi:fatty-acyl-CoA synthase